MGISLEVLPLTVAAFFVFAALSGLGHFKEAGSRVGRGRREELHAAYNALLAAAAMAAILIAIGPYVIRLVMAAAVLAVTMAGLYLKVRSPQAEAERLRPEEP